MLFVTNEYHVNMGPSHSKKKTRPEGLLDPKIRDEMSDFLEIFPTEDQI